MIKKILFSLVAVIVVFLAYAATRPEWTNIAALIGSQDMTAADAEYVRSVLISCGAKNYAMTLATENALLAVKHLESDGVPDAVRRTLEHMLFSVISDVSTR